MRPSRISPLVAIPAAIIAAGICIPLVYMIIRTLGVGEELWLLIFRPRTLDILRNTVALVIAVSLGSVSIAVPIAWLTSRTDLPLRSFWSVITALPLVIPSYVGSYLIIVAIGPKGILQGWLSPLGIESIPDIFGFPGAFLILTLLTYPYVLIPVRASMESLDYALEESSYSLGKGKVTTFLKVTLPLLRPAIGGGALLVALYTLSDFGAVSLLRFETFTWAIYVQYGSFARELAAGLSFLLIILAFLILVFESRTRGKGRYYRSSAGISTSPRLMTLGKWRWPALGLCTTVAIFSVLIPGSILVYWVIRGLFAGEVIGILWSNLSNSLLLSGLAAIATVIGSIPISILVVRHAGFIASLLERLSYIGFALPGIVVALALVFFGVNYFSPIYQTSIMLVFAYVILFLPNAIESTKSSLLQVSPALEEVARSLGKSYLTIIKTILLPLVRPGIIAGGALVFLLTMKELPATLILSPIGFKTLATSVWWYTEDGFFARSAVPSLMLILVSSVPLALVMKGMKGRF